ncbi:MAG: pyridoxamine 5'-phosphate oxidase [Halieaceae bacterium]|jgi:pyridoxamine 5'-phosphate oxidase
MLRQSSSPAALYLCRDRADNGVCTRIRVTTLDIEHFRREYLYDGLHRKDLHENPLSQFEVWLEQAVAAGIQDPTAMSVATVDEQARPWQRIVLLKDFDQRGFVFYTNLGSRKAHDISGNAAVSLHFPWLALDRQVIVSGRATALGRMEVARYFLSRPRESKLAAWASHQSRPLSTRGLLEGQFTAMKQKFAAGEIPLPDFWGGFRVVPERVEFWQGGPHRLHDRFVYSFNADDGWSIERLAP